MTGSVLVDPLKATSPSAPKFLLRQKRQPVGAPAPSRHPLPELASRFPCLNQRWLREGAMSIYETLKADHDQARALLSQIAGMSPGAVQTRRHSFEKLKEMMTAHSRAEEKVFYSALKGSEEAKDDALEGY